MPNEEVLGPRKTMFVLVIVVGCFAVLWPRILSPLILGQSRDQLKPNAFDREAGCCEVMFETELAVLELINEVCSSAVHADGRLSPYAAVECRKAVNETCGLDIAAFLKRSDNIGKTSKKLVETMKNSNSSCLKEHFGVPVWSLGAHHALNSWTLQDTVKQERPTIRGSGPHPALRERGRAIPPGAAPARPVTAMPPHVRVRSSPLSVYYELDIKPPPIPGMRPPLGSPGGPVPAPKSSMGFVMPIYTICIIVFFVYTLSKILFKRTASPYEPVSPDPQFRSRVFRDDSRTSPDKLVVTAISGLVAEVQQQMDASHAQNQQRQEAQDDHSRPYTNGTILHSTGPVHIVASEYRESSKEKSPEPQKEASVPDAKEADKITKESLETKEELTDKIPSKEAPEDLNTNTNQEKTPEGNDLILAEDQADENASDDAKEESGSEPELIEINHKEDELMKLTDDVDESDEYVKVVQDFLNEESKVLTEEKQSTQELLEEAIKEDSPDKPEDDQENASVKVVGMEVTAHTADGGAVPRAAPPAPPTHAPPQRPHEAEEVKSIFLETEIPQQSRVLVTEFAEDRPGDAPTTDSPMVVSGKMTLSLIQDAPRDTPEKDPESTVDDFTTASAITQPPADKQEEESEEEVEIEEEIEEIEVEVDEDIEEIDELPEETKEVQVKEAVRVQEEVKVIEPVTVQEEVKVTGPVFTGQEDIKVTEPVKVQEEVKDTEPVRVQEDIKVTELVKVQQEVKLTEPVQVQDVKVAEPVKVSEPVKEDLVKEETVAYDSKEIENNNKPVKVTEPVKEQVLTETIKEEPGKGSVEEEVAEYSEEEIQEHEEVDEPVKLPDLVLKEPVKEDSVKGQKEESAVEESEEEVEEYEEEEPAKSTESVLKEMEEKPVKATADEAAAKVSEEEIEEHEEVKPVKVTESVRETVLKEAVKEDSAKGPKEEAAVVESEEEVEEYEEEEEPAKATESVLKEVEEKSVKATADEAAAEVSEEEIEKHDKVKPVKVTELVREPVLKEAVKEQSEKETEEEEEEVSEEELEEYEEEDDEAVTATELVKAAEPVKLKEPVKDEAAAKESKKDVNQKDVTKEHKE